MLVIQKHRRMVLGDRVNGGRVKNVGEEHVNLQLLQLFRNRLHSRGVLQHR